MQEWVRLALETCNGTTAPKTRAKLELIAAGAATVFGLDPALLPQACERALFYQDPGDVRAIARAKYFLGHALRVARRLADAESTLREARAGARACGAQSEYALATQALATVRFDVGDLDDARALLSETLSLERAARSDQHAASAAVTLAEVEFAAGDAEKAVHLSEEAAVFFRVHADSLRLAWTLSNLSAYLVASDRYAEARGAGREALRSARAVGQTRIFGWALQHLAAVAVLDRDRSADRMELARAAKLVGYVDSLSGEGAFHRDRTERQEYERILSVLNGAFANEELAKLMSDGREWSEDEAFAQALEI